LSIDYNKQKRKAIPVCRAIPIITAGLVRIKEVAMKRSSCLDQYPLVENSPPMQLANELLWGDWDKGQYGVVL
jgi:hypothetical protein